MSGLTALIKDLKNSVSKIEAVQNSLSKINKMTLDKPLSEKRALQVLKENAIVEMPADNYSKYIQEEFNEFIVEHDKTAEQYKELCDLIWVCIQKANMQGYDLSKGLQELVDEYFSKFYTKDGVFMPIYRDDGKLLKNTGFKKADFKKLIHY